MEIKDVLEYQIREDFCKDFYKYKDEFKNNELKALTQHLREKSILLDRLKKTRLNLSLPDEKYVEENLFRLFSVSIKNLNNFGKSLLGKNVSKIDITIEGRNSVSEYIRTYHAFSESYNEDKIASKSALLELQERRKIILYGKPISKETNGKESHFSDSLCLQDAIDSGIYIFDRNYNVLEGKYTPEELSWYDIKFFAKYYPEFSESIRYGLTEEDIELSKKEISVISYEGLAERYSYEKDYHLSLAAENLKIEEEAKKLARIIEYKSKKPN